MVRVGSWMPWTASAVIYAGLAVLVGRDVIAGLSTMVAPDSGDPVFTATLLYWNATRVPLTGAWWQLPIFHPTADTLAFSEHLLGLSVLSTPLYWLIRDPIAVHNVMMLLTFPLCGMAMYALVRRLTGSAAAAFVAGLTFAFAPYRAGQLPHIHVLAAFWAPLALLGLHAYLDTRRRRWLAVYAAAWVFHVTTNTYMLVLLSTLIGLWVLWFVVAARRWRELWEIGLTTAVGFLLVVPILATYVTVHARHGFTRSIGEIREFSADIGAVLCAPRDLSLWGWLRLNCRPEAELFPGLAVSALAIAAMVYLLATRDRPAVAAGTGRTRPRRILTFVRAALLLTAGLSLVAVISVLAAGPWSVDAGFFSVSASTIEKPVALALGAVIAWLVLGPGIRAALRQSSVLGFYVMAAVVTWTLALGPTVVVMGRPLAVDGPFALMMALPGVGGLRVPARFWLMTLLCLAVASGLVISTVSRSWPRRIAAPAILVLTLVVLSDGWMRIPTVAAPRPAPAPAMLAGQTVIELVPGEISGDVAAGYRAVTGGWNTVNGYSGYLPRYYVALRDTFRAEEGTGLDWFRRAGALHVIVPREAPRLMALVEGQPGAVLTAQNWWASQYRLPPRVHPRPAAVKGRQMSIVRLESPCSADALPLASDGDERTPWRCLSDARQVLTADLGRVMPVGMVIQRLGPYHWEFPRRLEIETSADGATWREARAGSVLGEVIEGAFADPRSVAVVLPFEPRPARFIRLRHRSFEAGIGWTVAELEVWSSRPES